MSLYEDDGTFNGTLMKNTTDDNGNETTEMEKPSTDNNDKLSMPTSNIVPQTKKRKNSLNDRNPTKKKKTQDDIDEQEQQHQQQLAASLTVDNKWTFKYPLFLSPKYKIEKISSKHFLTTTIQELCNPQTIYCNKCGISQKVKCGECKILKYFDSNFILKTNFFACIIPNVQLMMSKNFTFFESFLRWVKVGTDYLAEHPDDKNSIKSIIIREYKKYLALMDLDFKGGKIAKQISGKKSFIRNNVLAQKLTSLRLVLIIDCQLGPGEVSISKKLIERIDLRSFYVLLNRDPSINSLCVCVSKILVNDYDDLVIRISPFVADGLHADVDGDAINCFIIVGPSNNIYDSYNADLASRELLQNSWEKGRRITAFQRPKYSFGQYYNYVIYKYFSHLKKIIPFLKRLKCEREQVPKVLMHMLCTTHYDLADNIISNIISFAKNLKTPLLTCDEIFWDNDRFLDIVKSKSKGTLDHITQFRDNCKKNQIPKGEFLAACRDASFNHFVTGSKKMSKNGREMFQLQGRLEPLLLLWNKLYHVDVVCCDKFYREEHSMLTCTLEYNVLAVTEMFQQLIFANLDVLNRTSSSRLDV